MQNEKHEIMKGLGNKNEKLIPYKRFLTSSKIFSS